MAVSLPGWLATALTRQRRSRSAVMALGAISLSGPHVRLVHRATTAQIPSARHRVESHDGQTRPSPASQSRGKPTRQGYSPQLSHSCSWRIGTRDRVMSVGRPSMLGAHCWAPILGAYVLGRRQKKMRCRTHSWSVASLPTFFTCVISTLTARWEFWRATFPRSTSSLDLGTVGVTVSCRTN